MYNIGDKIVYPMHGAGIIESIEEKEILGKTQKYFVLKMPVGGMKVMIPTDNIEVTGVRDVVEFGVVDQVLSSFGQPNDNCETLTWNKRYRENMTKIKSGDIFEVAEVVKSLMIREKERGLSTGERKMLCSAKQILISELILAKDVEQCEIEDFITRQIESQVS